MDINELKPIIDLLTAQEERFIKKIEEVHTDVVETRDQARVTNGRVTKAEKDIIVLQSDLKSVCKEYTNKFNNLDPTLSTVKFLNYITKKPKFSIALFITVIVIIQTLVLEANDNNWLKSLIDLIP